MHLFSFPMHLYLFPMNLFFVISEMWQNFAEKMLPFEKKKMKPIADELRDAEMTRMRPSADDVSTSNMSMPVWWQREKPTGIEERASLCDIRSSDEWNAKTELFDVAAVC